MNSIHNGLSSLLQSYRQIQARTAESMKILGFGKRIPHPKVDPTAWRDITWHKTQAEDIQNSSDNLATAGISVRVASSAMDATAKHLELLSQKLASAAEAPPGSGSKRQNLDEFNRVVASMADLASPPDPGAARLLGDPNSVTDAGDITIRAGKDFSLTLRHQPIHLGEDGLNVTPIADPEAFSRDEIQAAATNIEAAQRKLAARRQSLAADANAIASSEKFNTAAIGQNITAAERLDTPDLNREAALLQSMGIRTSIAVHGLTSLNETRLQALQLLP